MLRWLVFVSVSVSFCRGLSAQNAVIFNKTGHDFGNIAPTELAFEEDFLLRNTGQLTLQILTVKSVNRALSFVFTRSEIHTGEYGFVKVRLHTDSLSGLLHDEVYVTMRHGSEIRSEVLYVRALVQDNGQRDNHRKFLDSKAAVSVEVSPLDIASMEGFLNPDRLSQAESEIQYLKRQLALKGNLVARLTDDLRIKRDQELENMSRLAEMETAIRKGDALSREGALKHLFEMSAQFTDAHRMDSALRIVMREQEDAQERLRISADSARSHAAELSKALAAQFKSQAEASERAAKLERDLDAKLKTEAVQRQRIDSLQTALQRGHKDETLVRQQIDKLAADLAWRQKEHALQQAFETHQQQKIEALRLEREKLHLRTDSLHRFLGERAHENLELQTRLEGTHARITVFQREIDSLNAQLEHNVHAEQLRKSQLDSLHNALRRQEENEHRLREDMTRREAEMAAMQSTKEDTERNLKSLEQATERQLEEAHKLMHRVNQLSEREAAARSEAEGLRSSLKQSLENEELVKAQLAELSLQVMSKDTSLLALKQSLVQRETALKDMEQRQRDLEHQYAQANQRLRGNSLRMDSLKSASANTELQKTKLEQEIARVRKQIIESSSREEYLRVQKIELENRLTNAHMSNAMVFDELIGDVRTMAAERDHYKQRSAALEDEVQRLRSQMAFVTGESSVPAKPRPLESTASLVYRVHVMSTDKPERNVGHLRKHGEVHEYAENGRYRYAIGSEPSLNEALKLKDKLKASGFETAYVVVFREGKKISLKEAIELADSGK